MITPACGKDAREEKEGGGGGVTCCKAGGIGYRKGGDRWRQFGDRLTLMGRGDHTSMQREGRGEIKGADAHCKHPLNTICIQAAATVDL